MSLPLPTPDDSTQILSPDGAELTMPMVLTPEMLRAVRDDPLCQVEGEQWHARLGWLICAWDVLVSQAERKRHMNPARLADAAMTFAVYEVADENRTAGELIAAMRVIFGNALIDAMIRARSKPCEP